MIVLVKSMRLSISAVFTQVARTRAPSCDQWSRCSNAISHCSTSGAAPRRAPIPARSALTVCSLSVLVSSECQALVVMHRPVSRLASIDSPTHPSMTNIVGSTSSRTNSMPASIESGRPRNVLERAYMLFTSLPERRLWVAPQFAAHTSPAPAG